MISCQQFAVGLHRVAAAGGCHQHRIQIPFNTVHALHQIRRQLAGQLQLPLVMTHGATAALIRRNHHLKAVGLQHLHRGVAHIWIEAALDAAQQQGNAAAAFTVAGLIVGRASLKLSGASAGSSCSMASISGPKSRVRPERRARRWSGVPA